MIGHTFLTLLLPLFIALFYFSTPQSRRRPIFVLNVVVIILAFIGGVMIDALAVSELSPQGRVGERTSLLMDIYRFIPCCPFKIHGPQQCATLSTVPWLQISFLTQVNIAIGIIGAFQNIFVDFILLIRLTSVHPLSHLGLIRFGILTALPVLLKIARVTNMIIFIKALADASRGPLGAENLAIVWATTPYLKIEWSAGVVDNA